MAGKIDALVKLSIVASVLLASSGIAYYYAVYLPERDARIDADKAAVEQHRSEEQLAAQIAYDGCIRKAQEVHNSVWASSCRRIAEDDPKKHASCIATGLAKQTCDAMYSHDASPNCALPSGTAQNLEASLNKARDRCLQASKAGLL
jgi:hypothetical protein